MEMIIVTTMMKRIQKSPKIKKMPVILASGRHLPENLVFTPKMARNIFLIIRTKMAIQRNKNVKAFLNNNVCSKMSIVLISSIKLAVLLPLDQEISLRRAAIHVQYPGKT